MTIRVKLAAFAAVVGAAFALGLGVGSAVGPLEQANHDRPPAMQPGEGHDEHGR